MAFRAFDRTRETVALLVGTEPDGLDIYSDSLLLIDTLERHAVTDLPDLETATLVNLYTLLSDVQRDANDLRQEVTDVLLLRLHHDRPVAGQYGSVQRTSRCNRLLKDDEDVLSMLEAEGIDRERVMSVDRQKVDEALEDRIDDLTSFRTGTKVQY